MKITKLKVTNTIRSVLAAEMAKYVRPVIKNTDWSFSPINDSIGSNTIGHVSGTKRCVLAMRPDDFAIKVECFIYVVKGSQTKVLSVKEDTYISNNSNPTTRSYHIDFELAHDMYTNPANDCPGIIMQPLPNYEFLLWGANAHLQTEDGSYIKLN